MDDRVLCDDVAVATSTVTTCWQYVALLVVLWHPALSLLASASSLSASVSALR